MRLIRKLLGKRVLVVTTGLAFAALTVPTTAQTIYEIDINGANGPTEAGWTGLTVVDPSEGDNVTVGGVTFTVNSSDGSRNRTLANSLTRDFIFDDGAGEAVGLTLSGLPSGVYRASVWAWDQNAAVGAQQVLTNGVQGGGEHHFTNAFIANPTTPYNFVIDRDDYNASFGIYTREMNGANRSRLNALRLELIDGKFADLSGGTGNWTDAAGTWSPDGVPAASDSVFIGNATVNLSLSGDTISRLTVGHTRGASGVVNAVPSPSQNGDGTLNINGPIGSSLTVTGDFRIGEDSGTLGTINHNDGTINADRLVATRWTGSTSNYNLNGGSLSITGNGWASFAGNGTFTQTGGTASFGNFIVTQPGQGATGALQLNGGNFTTGGLTPGDGAATVTMNGGTLIAGASFSTPAPITILAGGGTLDTDGNTVTFTGNDFTVDAGTFAKTGAGAMTIDSRQLRVGFAPGANGTLQMTEGTINVGGDFRFGENNLAFGTINHDGGTINADRLVSARLNGSNAAYNMNDGNLNVTGDGWATLQGTGAFTQIGGNVTIGNTYHLTHATLSAGKTGILNLNGGTFTTDALSPGNGIPVVTMNGGTLRSGTSFSTPLDIALNAPNGGMFDSNGNTLTLAGDLSGTGGLTKTGTGTVQLDGNNSFSGPINVDNGILEIRNTNAVSNSTSIHLGDNGVLDVTAIAGGGYSFSGVTVSGIGLIDATGGSVSLVGGTLSPGNSPGQMDVSGNVNGLGSYDWELFDAGLAPGTGWDHLNLIDPGATITILPGDIVEITGLNAIMPDNAGIPFNLDVSMIGAITGPLTIATAPGGISGLANLSLDFGNLAPYGTFAASIAGPGNEFLQLTFTSTVAIPEPGTVALMALLLSLGFVYLRNRRKTTA